MEAIRRTVRPKHQVLILKCYPRLPKNSSAAEIKPNGSELSYLLYYASSRRSKLSKVGAFLEKKTAHDLHKGRTATVQITLQILTAFLNNPAIGGAGAQGFGLFAPYVLRLLREVLSNASEAILIESSVPMWDSFCRHQDHVTLNADADFCALFASIVTLWAGYATKEQVQQTKTAVRRGRMRVGVTDNVKLRMAGLQALKSIADSETLGTEAGRQLDTIMPVVLQNLYDGDGDLHQIMVLNSELQVLEKEKPNKPRASMMTDRRPTSEDGDARAAGGTTDEADRLADQEASLLALRCLKSIFTFENRHQIRSATNCVLRFTLAHRPNPIKSGMPQNDEETESQWAVQLFRVICTWVPVQDRFVAVFTAVEMLIRSPTVEEDLPRQLLLTRIISKLLASDTNLIGLSIMDVLLGVLQHLVKLVQLGDITSAPDGPATISSINDAQLGPGLATTLTPIAVTLDKDPRKNSIRARLLSQLQSCVTNLAVHVYYTDQISDMILAIILRIRPSQQQHSLGIQNRPGSAAATASPQAASDENAASLNSDTALTNHSSPRGIGTRPVATGFVFASPLKREVALNAIANIIQCANTSTADSHVASDRNAVPLSAWDGTQWLLRDPDNSVRAAYIRAFSVWIKHEFPRLGLDKGLDEEMRTEKERKRKSLNSDLARRAASSASAKKAATRRVQTAVLQTIHLAVVDALSQLDKDFQVVERAQRTGENGQDKTLVARNELLMLDEALNKLSETLRLPSLDEFRASNIPPVPNPPSPKAHSGSFDTIPEYSRQQQQTQSPEWSRRPSNAPSLSNLRSGSISGRSANGGGGGVVQRSSSLGHATSSPATAATALTAAALRNVRGTSRSPAPGVLGGNTYGGRYDLANVASSVNGTTANSSVRGGAGQVEDLKRLLINGAGAMTGNTLGFASASSGRPSTDSRAGENGSNARLRGHQIEGIDHAAAGTNSNVNAHGAGQGHGPRNVSSGSAVVTFDGVDHGDAEGDGVDGLRHQAGERQHRGDHDGEAAEDDDNDDSSSMMEYDDTASSFLTDTRASSDERYVIGSGIGSVSGTSPSVIRTGRGAPSSGSGVGGGGMGGVSGRSAAGSRIVSGASLSSLGPGVGGVGRQGSLRFGGNGEKRKDVRTLLEDVEVDDDR